MRFDTPVFFQKRIRGEYDPETGDYADDHVEETCVFASVYDTGASSMRLVYGEIRKGSVTIALQSRYDDSFQYIRIGKKIYTVDMERKHRIKHTFIASEVSR